MNAVTPDLQAGDARFWVGDNVNYHAGLWRGSAESWVDLNPGPDYTSQIFGASGQFQVGWIIQGREGRAAIWSGTADSLLDLHALLPSYFSDSQATSAFAAPNGTIYVGGNARNDITGLQEAILWTFIPSPGAFSCLALAGVSLAGRRRRPHNGPNLN